MKIDLDTASCSGPRDSSSFGIEPFELENSEPPIKGFLLDPLDLSISIGISSHLEMKQASTLTFKSGLNGIHDRSLEDISLSPDLDEATDLLLNFGDGSLVGVLDSICHNLCHALGGT